MENPKPIIVSITDDSVYFYIDKYVNDLLYYRYALTAINEQMLHKDNIIVLYTGNDNTLEIISRASVYNNTKQESFSEMCLSKYVAEVKKFTGRDEKIQNLKHKFENEHTVVKVIPFAY